MIWRIAAALALLAGLVLGYGAWAKRIGDIREAAVVARYTEAALIADRAARAKEQAMQAKITKAVNASTERQKKLALDAGTLRAERDRLRSDLAAVRDRLPSLARDALERYASAAGGVFEECSEAYSGVATDAGQLASDRQTLIDGWPK